MLSRTIIQVLFICATMAMVSDGQAVQSSSPPSSWYYHVTNPAYYTYDEAVDYVASANIIPGYHAQLPVIASIDDHDRLEHTLCRYKPGETRTVAWIDAVINATNGVWQYDTGGYHRYHGVLPFYNWTFASLGYDHWPSHGNDRRAAYRSTVNDPHARPSLPYFMCPLDLVRNPLYEPPYYGPPQLRVIDNDGIISGQAIGYDAPLRVTDRKCHLIIEFAPMSTNSIMIPSVLHSKSIDQIANWVSIQAMRQQSAAPPPSPSNVLVPTVTPPVSSQTEQALKDMISTFSVFVEDTYHANVKANELQAQRMEEQVTEIEKLTAANDAAERVLRNQTEVLHRLQLKNAVDDAIDQTAFVYKIIVAIMMVVMLWALGRYDKIYRDHQRIKILLDEQRKIVRATNEAQAAHKFVTALQRHESHEIIHNEISRLRLVCAVASCWCTEFKPPSPPIPLPDPTNYTAPVTQIKGDKLVGLGSTGFVCSGTCVINGRVQQIAIKYLYQLELVVRSSRSDMKKSWCQWGILYRGELHSDFPVPNGRRLPPHPHISWIRGIPARTIIPESIVRQVKAENLVTNTNAPTMRIIMERHDIHLQSLITQRIEQHHPLTEQEVLHIARHMIDALHHVHTHGFAHRDVKPDNIMLDGIELRDAIANNQPITPAIVLSSRVVLIDFSEGYDAALEARVEIKESKDIKDVKTSEGKEGNYNWTPRVDSLGSDGGQGIGGAAFFKAPEAKNIVNGRFNYEKSDVYALGVVLSICACASPTNGLATPAGILVPPQWHALRVLIGDMVVADSSQRIHIREAMIRIATICSSCYHTHTPTPAGSAAVSSSSTAPSQSS